MKKLFTALAASALLLTSCGSGASDVKPSSVYIPSEVVLKSVMETAGYQVAQAGDFDTNGYTMFSASNGEQDENYDGFILMRAKNADDIDDKSKAQSAEKDNLVMFALKNDATYGNVIVIGTDNAIKKAGIRIG